METKFWIERWEQKQIGFHQAEVNLLLKAYWDKLALPVDSTVLVPLCGKSLDMLWLAAQGHRVIGVELSEIAVREFFLGIGQEPQISWQGGFKLFSVNNISIYCGNFFELSKEQVGSPLGVFDRAALIALPPNMRRDYVNHLQRLLPSGAKTLLVSLEYDQVEISGPPFCVLPEDVQALFSANCDVICLGSQESDVKGVAAVERLYMLSQR